MFNKLFILFRSIFSTIYIICKVIFRLFINLNNKIKSYFTVYLNDLYEKEKYNKINKELSDRAKKLNKTIPVPRKDSKFTIAGIDPDRDPYFCNPTNGIKRIDDDKTNCGIFIRPKIKLEDIMPNAQKFIVHNPDNIPGWYFQKDKFIKISGINWKKFCKFWEKNSPKNIVEIHND